MTFVDKLQKELSRPPAIVGHGNVGSSFPGLGHRSIFGLSRILIIHLRWSADRAFPQPGRRVEAIETNTDIGRYLQLPRLRDSGPRARVLEFVSESERAFPALNCRKSAGTLSVQGYTNCRKGCY